MRDNYKTSLVQVLTHEGGWSDHKNDPGGATMKGVTIGRFQEHKGRPVTKTELRNISDKDLAAIYRTYWDAVRGDQLPSGVDHVAFDSSVNSGPSRSIKFLQKAVGAVADGRIGPNTMDRVSKSDPISTVSKMCAVRMGFLRGLKTWGSFGRGWSRRVAEVEALGLALAAKASGVDVKGVLVAKRRQVESEARREAQTAGGASAGGLGATGLAGMPSWATAALVVTVVVLVVVYIGQRRHNLDRVTAFRAVSSDDSWKSTAAS